MAASIARRLSICDRPCYASIFMAKTAGRIWLDGKIVDLAHGALPLMAHGSQRGSLVFDVGSFAPAAGGLSLFRARDHVARFFRSASIVGLEIPFSEETLVAAAREVVRASSATGTGLVRWSVFFAAAEPDLLPLSHATHVAIALQTLDETTRRDPLKIAVFDDARKAPPDVLPPETKAAGAYLGPMLFRARAAAQGMDDVVLLDRHGDIAEAPIANAFAVVDGALWTPPLGHILPGITRRTVLEIARELGIAVREERLPRAAFESADEAFLTSTSTPLAPIASINGKALRGGPVTERLLTAVQEARRTREAWLTAI
jgi:branched-chain amino acid aminotransferase